MRSKETQGVYDSTQKILEERLSEKAPALLQLLVGPRQVGKATLLMHLGSGTGFSGAPFQRRLPRSFLKISQL